jgi:zinc protease
MRMFAAPLLLLVALSCTLAARPGAALAADSERSPTAGVVKVMLPNGLRVLVLPRHTAPVVTTMMWYRIGSRDELPGQTGIAHFLEHLMFKGTKKLAKGAVDRITYQNGGSNNAFTSNDYTGYEFNLPKANWKIALAIEADRMRNSIFDAKEFEAERQVVMEERRGGEDDPSEQFTEQVNAAAFLVHPYRNPVVGWMDDLKRLSREQVLAIYRTYYVPANATLVIVGDVQPEEAIGAARQAFAAVPKYSAPVRRVVSEPAQIAARRVRLSLPTQVQRLELVFPGVTRSHADAPPLLLLSYALTEGKLSRLHHRLVDQDRLAAEVDGGALFHRDLGEIDFDVSAREGATLDGIEEVLWEELERAGREPISDRELERARNQFYSDWIQGLNTANSLASVLGEADALGGVDYLETLLPRLQRVTPADVQRVARTYFRRDRCTTGHLYPASGGNDARSETAALASAGEGERERRRDEERRSTASTHGRSMTAATRAGRGPLARGQTGLAAAAHPILPYPHTPTLIVRRTSPRPSRTSRAAFAPLSPTERVLPNGMRLVLLENHALPSITLSARVDAGSNMESAAEAGLANFTAGMLNEGTTKRSDQEIAAELEQVGATFSASAGRASTYVSLQSLSRYTAGLIPLYAELLQSPAFPADRLEQERARLMVALKEAADDAPTVGRNAFNDLVYGTHPAHRPVVGYEPTVRTLSREALARFHGRYYRPENTTLVAVGDFQTSDLLERLTAALSGWERGSGTPAAAPPAPERQTERRDRRITMEKSQTQIVLGHLGVTRTSPDYPALRVMDTILGEGVGGGFTARIPWQLRDVMGLAYGVGSSITSTAAKDPGVFIVVMGTAPKNEAAAIPALLKEIQRIRTSPVTKKELREAENYLANSYVFDFQTNEQLAAYLHAVQYYGLGYNYRQRFPEEIRKVTRADVLRVAQKYLDPEHYTLVVVAPGAAPR